MLPVDRFIKLRVGLRTRRRRGYRVEDVIAQQEWPEPPRSVSPAPRLPAAEVRMREIAVHEPDAYREDAAWNHHRRLAQQQSDEDAEREAEARREYVRECRRLLAARRTGNS